MISTPFKYSKTILRPYLAAQPGDGRPPICCELAARYYDNADRFNARPFDGRIDEPIYAKRRSEICRNLRACLSSVHSRRIKFVGRLAHGQPLQCSQRRISATLQFAPWMLIYPMAPQFLLLGPSRKPKQCSSDSGLCWPRHLAAGLLPPH